MPDEVVVKEEIFSLEVEEGPPLAEVRITETVYVSEPRIEIIAVGEQGPSGAPGAPGAPGVSPGAPRIEEFIVSGSVPAVHVLTDSPQPQTLALFINGLRQATNAFSALGPTVTLPASLEIGIGDLITFTYQMN